ncbi:hypothetical protein BDV95DRAFT_582364 [Massariosphaeria phaeospora]|uniref:FAD-binding domain-containing protein n=1 Tax=Massariosphaeria phaeospora TaxID=100035 RepID=A0A7C8I822_9PLEO|nr:hypothetical protein BDV95DRAFT_582364 [Massariosphaeria phaeospora]
MAQSEPSPTTKVLIAGAGLSGLFLAQGLRKYNVDFQIFEQDPTPDMRSQGYRIKIFPDGVANMKYLLDDGIWQQFTETVADTVMGESALNAIDASFISSRKLRGPVPFTVDRGVLRRTLLKGLEGKISWGKKYAHHTIENDKVTVEFEDGTSEVGSLLVGADGSRSRVRQQMVPDYRVMDAEGICLYGRTELTPELQSRITPKVTKWLTLCRDIAGLIQQIIFDSELPVTMFIEKMHFPHRDIHPELPEDYMYFSMLLPSRLLGPTPELLAQALKAPPHELGLQLSEEWDPSIRCLLELQDPTAAAVLQVATTTPDIPVWTPNEHVTLLGDSIHLMSPAGGVGAGTALMDAASLTKILTQGPATAEKIGTYEAEMRKYAKVALERSFRGGKTIFGQPDFENCKEVKME